jgi:hypothetical protein
VFIFCYSTASGPALMSTQLPIQWVSGTISLGVKRQGHEAHHWLASSAEVKNGRLHPKIFSAMATETAKEHMNRLTNRKMTMSSIWAMEGRKSLGSVCYFFLSCVRAQFSWSHNFGTIKFTLAELIDFRCQPGIFILIYILLRSRDSSVGIATGYGLDDHGGREFESR